jgi:hypothetical protein
MSPEQRDCDHQWGNRSGEPLACLGCGVEWPGDDAWPPPYTPHVDGYGELGDDFVPWQRRVDRVVDELRRVA